MLGFMAFRPVIQPNYTKSSRFTVQHHSVLDYLRQLEEYFDQKTAGNTSDETLYSHQVKAVFSLHKYFNSDETVNPQNSQVALVVLPTGCGKTGVAVLASYVLNASRVLVITPSLIISKQVNEAYENFLIQRGIIGEHMQHLYVPEKLLVRYSSKLLDTYNVQRADLVITNAHKVNENPRARVRLEDISADLFDLVIVDEAHHYPARTWKRLVDHFPNSRKIFLTATPEHNGKPILNNPPYVCYKLSQDDAVRDGVIRKVDFSEVTGGDSDDEKFMVMILAYVL